MTDVKMNGCRVVLSESASVTVHSVPVGESVHIEWADGEGFWK